MILPKKIKGKQARRPFTPDEFTRLFSCPLFFGCASRARRFETGPVIIEDAKFWLPIVGYYTGARLGELVQLHVQDIDFSGPFPFLHGTEDYTGNAVAGEAKHVKSEAGVRRVPLHPDLIELGFQTFVEERALPFAHRY